MQSRNSYSIISVDMLSHPLLVFQVLLLLHFVLFLLFDTCIGSVDPKFEACVPKTCGNGPYITYPFYILDKQEASCGYPGFDLTCDNNGFPILPKHDNEKYVVEEIFYANHSLRVSILFSKPTSTECFPPPDYSFSGDNRYRVAPNQQKVYLFYNCNLMSLKEYRIECPAQNQTSSAVALYGNDPNWGLAWQNCSSKVLRTTVEDDKRGIVEGLRRGFVLNWMASSCEECSGSGGRCGFDYGKDAYAFRCFCRDGVHIAKCDPQSESEKIGHKLVFITIAVSAVSGIGILTIIIHCFRRKLWFHILNGLWKGKPKPHQDFEAFLMNHGPLPIKRYSYLEIKKMTNSLSEKLGQGGCGGVFKGKIHDERLVAVKMLDRSKDNGDEFMNEVASISRTSHVNIVTLLGFCFEGSKRALVYEYMANGSLDKFIHGTNPMAVDNQLNCETLYQIAIGVARGLEYLHRGCNTRIFHFDIKPHNILLDENFCPKISDFGLAKVCPRDESMVSMLDARGTPGYIAPEVFSRSIGVVSHKSDVYGFGMMVLEMVGGRKNINVEVDCTSEIYFPYWIYKRLELNEELDLKNITNESDKERTRKMVIVSLWCIQIVPSNRPTMRKVVDMLEGRAEALQIPPKPFLSSP